ncbi:MAG TPA: ABC transporter permease, partial [Tepidisphaeraceae bacterium]
GTSPQMFGFDDQGKPVTGHKFQYREDRSYELAEGRVFGPRKFEAVIGSDVASSLHMHLYDDKLSEAQNLEDGGAFRATHGMPGPNQKPDIHKPRWHIVGILKPTHTANDRVLFIPFISLYAIAEHEEGLIDQTLMKANIDPSRIPPAMLDQVLAKLGIDPRRTPESVKKKFKMQSASNETAIAKAPTDINELLKTATVAPAPVKKEEEGEDPDAYHLDAKGDIIPDLPPEDWEISAILVQTRGGIAAEQLIYNFKVIDDRATAVNPATVMRGFFDTFLSSSTKVLLLIAAFVSIVAAASIMTTIYNSVSARLREIAILRALGATRARILTLICVEAVLIGLGGGLLGFIVGHALSGAGSEYLTQTIGEGINWIAIGNEEWGYLALVVVMAFLAGLVPALKAYRTPVATNLVAT